MLHHSNKLLLTEKLQQQEYNRGEELMKPRLEEQVAHGKRHQNHHDHNTVSITRSCGSIDCDSPTAEPSRGQHSGKKLGNQNGDGGKRGIIDLVHTRGHRYGLL